MKSFRGGIKAMLISILNSGIFLFVFNKIQAIGNGMARFCTSLVSKKTNQYVFSLVCALILSFSCYLVENQPFSFSDKSFLFYIFEMPFRQLPHDFDRTVKFVNVSHDRQLVPIDPTDSALGNTDITDRRKLLQFLNRLEDEDVEYQAIMLDIRFEKNLRTDVDSILFNKIFSMRDIVVAHHKSDPTTEYKIADSLLLDKAGYADYKQVAYESNFFRYPFLQEQGPSLALKLYDVIRAQPASIKKLSCFPIYWCDKRLCTNCPLLPIHGDVYDKWVSPYKQGKGKGFNEHFSYYEDLGADWLAWESDIRDWRTELKGAYIVIGDFENDVHDTYAGPRSGAFINWLAYVYLEAGSHILSWSYVCLIFIFYALMVYFMFFLSNFARKPGNENNKPLLFFLSILRWLGTIGLLYFMTFVFYKIFKVRYNVTIPIFFIAIINFIIQNTNKTHEKDITSDTVHSVDA
jgi:hypothetical protein